MSRLEDRMEDLTRRVSHLEITCARNFGSLSRAFAEHSARMDRVDSRLARIERRLDFADALI